jgi:hypothetical protein
MISRMRLVAGLLLATMAPACSSPQPPAVEPEVPVETVPALPPEPDQPLPDDPAAPSAGPVLPGLVVYACDDGRSLTVTYAEHSALVKLPTGSIALPRAESASSGGGDAYIGEELSLYREGNRVQLQSGDAPRTCTESPTGR